MTMKRTAELILLMNFFAEMLRETLDEWYVSQAEVSRMTGIALASARAMQLVISSSGNGMEEFAKAHLALPRPT